MNKKTKRILFVVIIAIGLFIPALIMFLNCKSSFQGFKAGRSRLQNAPIIINAQKGDVFQTSHTGATYDDCTVYLDSVLFDQLTPEAKDKYKNFPTVRKLPEHVVVILGQGIGSSAADICNQQYIHASGCIPNEKCTKNFVNIKKDALEHPAGQEFTLKCEDGVWNKFDEKDIFVPSWAAAAYPTAAMQCGDKWKT